MSTNAWIAVLKFALWVILKSVSRWTWNTSLGNSENGKARFKPVKSAENILVFFSSIISCSVFSSFLTDLPPFFPFLKFFLLLCLPFSDLPTPLLLDLSPSPSFDNEFDSRSTFSKSAKYVLTKVLANSTSFLVIIV